MTKTELLRLAEKCNLGHLAENDLWIDFRATMENVLKFAAALAATQSAPMEDIPLLKAKAFAFDEWIERTNWVQEQMSTFPIKALGMHRADVMREEIERLRAAQPAQNSQVDWLGLALDLEQQAKRVESQTVERSMQAAAHGLRLMGAAQSAQPQEPGEDLTVIGYADKYNVLYREKSEHAFNPVFAPAAQSAQPQEPMASDDLKKTIEPRPLSFALDDYWMAPSNEGELACQWKDKPHRLLYDLIAAVLYYAAPVAQAAQDSAQDSKPKHTAACLSVGGGPNDDYCICGADSAQGEKK